MRHFNISILSLVAIAFLSGCNLTSSNEELETKNDVITGQLDANGYVERELPVTNPLNLKVECEIIDPFEPGEWVGVDCKIHGRSGKTIIIIDLSLLKEVFAGVEYRINYTYSI